MLEDHLIKECQELLCHNTRKLMRVVERFEEFGVPKKISLDLQKLRALLLFESTDCLDRTHGVSFRPT
jgi:hypothetical protein